MRIVIHIEIGDIHSLSYTKEILSWIQESDPQVVTFDFDNHSDAAVINYGIELLKQGDKILVIISQLSKDDVRRLLKFVDRLTRVKSKSVLVLFNGKDPYIDTMLDTLSEGQVIKNIDVPTLQSRIKNFFGFR